MQVTDKINSMQKSAALIVPTSPATKSRDNTKAKAIYSSGKTAMIYLLISMFCVLFGGVYEIFSHGVFSFYMIYAFAFPLALGCFPFLLLHLKKITRGPKHITRIIYAMGIATFTVGSLVCGVLEIYGTESSLTDVYWIAGMILFLIGAISGIVQILKRHNN